MKRPFSNRRPLGPFAQTTEVDPTTYLVAFDVSTDEVLDGSTVNELEDSIQSLQANQQGGMIAVVEDVSINPKGFSAFLDPGEERTYQVKIEITPEIQGVEDRFILMEGMITEMENEVQDMLGETSGGWQIAAL